MPTFIRQSATLEAITPDALEVIERAGRTCYKSEERIGPGTAEAFVEMLIRRGHLSVLEHASATFRFITDRGITHELVRHRLCAFSQESTRYCNYGGKDVVFVEPEDSEGRCALAGADLDVWRSAMESAEKRYDAMILHGVSPQFARSVLPNSLKTEIVVTANFREWRHILRMRTVPAAHPSMRHLMNLAERELFTACPVVFNGDYKE